MNVYENSLKERLTSLIREMSAATILGCTQKTNGIGLFPIPFRIPFLFPACL